MDADRPFNARSGWPGSGTRWPACGSSGLETATKVGDPHRNVCPTTPRPAELQIGGETVTATTGRAGRAARARVFIPIEVNRANVKAPTVVGSWCVPSTSSSARVEPPIARSPSLGAVISEWTVAGPLHGRDEVAALVHASIEPETDRGLRLLFHLADHIEIGVALVVDARSRAPAERRDRSARPTRARHDDSQESRRVRSTRKEEGSVRSHVGFATQRDPGSGRPRVAITVSDHRTWARTLRHRVVGSSLIPYSSPERCDRARGCSCEQEAFWELARFVPSRERGAS